MALALAESRISFRNPATFTNPAKIWLRTSGHIMTGFLDFYWIYNKKLSYCWETVRRESIPKIAEMDVEMTT